MATKCPSLQWSDDKKHLLVTVALDCGLESTMRFTPEEVVDQMIELSKTKSTGWLFG